MKHYLPFIFLTLIICWKPIGTMNDTGGKIINPLMKMRIDTLPQKIVDSTIELKRKNDSLRVVKRKLFQEELKLQDEMAAKKTTVIVKEVPVIIYMPSDSVKKKDEADTLLKNNANTVTIKHKKKFFLFRLFHHKKRKK